MNRVRQIDADGRCADRSGSLWCIEELDSISQGRWRRSRRGKRRPIDVTQPDGVAPYHLYGGDGMGTPSARVASLRPGRCALHRR